MRFIIVLLFLVLLLNKALFAQVYSYGNNRSEAEEMKKRTLAVVRKTPNPYVLKFYSKDTAELKRYNQLIEVYNKHIEEIIADRWNYSSAIEIISEDRAEMIKKLGERRYALLEFGAYYPMSNTPTTGIPKPPALVITLANKPRTLVAFEIFQSVSLTKGLLTHHVDQLMNQLHDSFDGVDKYTSAWRRQIDRQTPDLKNKTVLICEDWMADEFRETIKNNNWKQKPILSYEVVTRKELDQHLLDHTKGYAFVFFHESLYIIVDVSSSRYMYFRGRYLHSSGQIVPKLIENISKEINKN